MCRLCGLFRTTLAGTGKRNKLGIPAPWGWTEAQLALLGTLPDAEVAQRTGRTYGAVRQRRCRLGIPNPSGPGWTAEELALLGTAPDAEVAAEIGRTEGAVTLKRCRLGIPTFCDRRVHSSRPRGRG